MLIVDRLQQFLSDFCNLSQFQVWKNINEDRFSLVISQGMEEQLAPSHDKKNIDVYEYQFQFHEKRQLVLRLHRALSATENQAIETLLHAYYLELMLEKEQFIRDKMMESIREISVLNDIHTLLTKILENALSVIPSADFGVLWMYDESEAALVPKAWVGGPGEDIKNMRMKVGEGIIGKTFKDNQSMILNSYTDVLKASSSVTEENLRHLLNAYTFEYLQSVIAVPIAVEEQTLCVVIIYQNGENALLTIEDKQLLESFSDQVSIALTNSKLFQNLKLQNELLLQRDQIHHTFMKLSLQNAGMQVIVNEIRHMLNLRLVIMDLMDDSIYASPRHWIEKGDLFRFVHLTETPAFYSLEVENEQVDYYIQPIIGVGQILGLLLIEINEQKLESIHKLIIEQASSIIALELIRKQTIVDSFYKKTHDLFHDFLTSKDPGQLMKKGEELGIQSNANYAVVLIQLSTGTDIQAMDMQVHLLISEIKKHFQDHAPIVFGFGHKITVLCQFKLIGNELLHLVQQFQGSWEKVKNNSLKIGVGTLYSGMDQIAKSYNEADKALSFLMTRQRWGIMHYQEIGVNRLFIHQTQEELLGFVNEVFLPLRNEKTKHHLLEETLLMYIKQNGSVGETAKQLHIHVNTLYQRLRKIEEKVNDLFSKCR